MEEEDWETTREREEREAREREAELQLTGVIERLAQDRDGRKFLRWIMESTEAFRPNYCVESYPLSAFKEGQRSFGLQVLGLCAKAGCAGVLFEEEVADGR